MNNTNLIPPHGGYKNLKSYQNSEIIADATYYFYNKWIKDYKLASQLNGAARSCKQCIAEDSINSTSKKLELKLIQNARGSLEELLLDYQDYLRQNKHELWNKNTSKAQFIRKLAYKSDKTYETYASFFDNAENTANTIICLIHQTNYLLDQLVNKLENDFLEKGGFTERMYQSRKLSNRVNQV
ncbi:four helix bundle protein [Candidatus Woesebacteria bacterium]|nr:MAG: four helix bundle protein [Candidatus Woesebacteria bacterium]